MRTLFALLRGFGLFALVVGFLVPLSVSAQGDATPAPGATEPSGYPISAYLCDTDPGPFSPYSGREIGGGCELAAGLQFVVTADVDPTYSEVCITGGDGTCYLQNPPFQLDNPVTLTITEDVSSLPDGYAPRENPVTGVNYTEFRGTTFINILTSPEDSTASPSTGAPAATETSTNQTAGSTAAIYLGDCDQDEFIDPLAQLTPVATPDGDAAGAADVGDVETSFSTILLSMDDLLGEDHAIVVFDQDDATVPLACGVIGGVVSEDGSLAFGLPLVGDSRYSGVAFLTPDDDATNVSLFLAENLSADETPTA